MDYDYDEHLADDATNDVANDVTDGRLMTCTGLGQLPTYLPPGLCLCVCVYLCVCLSVCVSVCAIYERLFL